MDPKMDSGMNAENIKTIDEAIELNSLPKELTAQQVIGVMDRLFVLEASTPYIALMTTLRSRIGDGDFRDIRIPPKYNTRAIYEKYSGFVMPLHKIGFIALTCSEHEIRAAGLCGPYLDQRLM